MRVWSRGIPAPADKSGQGGLPGDRAEQPQDLGIARGPIASSGVEALHQLSRAAGQNSGRAGADSRAFSPVRGALLRFDMSIALKGAVVRWRRLAALAGAGVLGALAATVLAVAVNVATGGTARWFPTMDQYR